MPEPVIQFVETTDGWKLATYRYKPKSTRYCPVILIHGLGTNRFDVDFPDPKISLAKHLYHQGFDTWVIELRGTGKSYAKGLLRPYLAKLRHTWDFDDYVFKDIPALVGFIQAKTGRDKLHWAGHSLGGTLIYAAIETMGNSVCASAVTLGAAMSASVRPGYVKFLLKVDPIVKKMPFIPLKTFAQMGSPLGRWVAPMEDNFFYSSANIDMQLLETAMKVAVENVSSPLFLQLHDWYKNNHFKTRDSKYSYRDNLDRIKAPFLTCAGSVDGMTPYVDVHFAHTQIGSRKKRFHVFGREHGCRTEYGHMDLILGKNSSHDVFPVIANWFKENDKKT